MDQELDERIRARAYAIWEAEGRPDGADLDHWRRAILELQTEEANDAEMAGDGSAVPSAPEGGELGIAATQPLDSEDPGLAEPALAEGPYEAAR
jgi:Protein of unknown function (DUF2934)